MTERENATCPTCGSDIPADAPGGLCPKCVLGAAAITLEEGTSPVSTLTGARFEPPSIEELQAAFPQLEIVELIGCGGMGAVYKARQPKLDRDVALKILPESLAGNESFTERFTREGRVLARLSHPNIVSVYDFGQSGEFPYLLMEFVDGVNLRQAMRAGRFTPEQAIGIVPKVCEALQYAHEQGVLHRDIKPENLLIDTRGEVKIVDFGIAKIVVGNASENDPTLITRTGVSMPGTPHYMAPEQVEKPAAVDHRADIYSLGVVFYEMLTGELPLGRFAAPSAKSPVNDRIDEIVLRTLEKERELRQQSAEELRTEVEGVDTELPVDTTAQASELIRSSRRMWTIGVTGIVIIALGLLILGAARETHLRSAAKLQVNAAALHQQKAVAESLLKNDQREGKRDEDIQSRLLRIERLESKVENTEADQRHYEKLARNDLLIIIGGGVAILILILILTQASWRNLLIYRKLRLSKRPSLASALTFPAVFYLAVGFVASIWVLQPAPAWIERANLIGSPILLIILGIWGIKKLRRWVQSGGESRLSSQHAENAIQTRVSRQKYVQRSVISVALIALFLIGGRIAFDLRESPPFGPIAPEERIALRAYVEDREDSAVWVSEGRELPSWVNNERATKAEVPDGNLFPRTPDYPFPEAPSPEKPIVEETPLANTEEKPASGGVAPSDIWYRAYLLHNEGEAVEEEDRLASLNKYSEAKRLIDALKSDFPEFHTEIVSFRSMELAKKIPRIRNELRKGITHGPIQSSSEVEEPISQEEIERRTAFAEALIEAAEGKIRNNDGEESNMFAPVFLEEAASIYRSIGETQKAAQTIGNIAPTQKWLAALRHNQQGEKSEQSGKLSEAVESYREAVTIIKSIGDAHPDFHPDLVSPQLKQLEKEAIPRVYGILAGIGSEMINIEDSPLKPEADQPETGDTVLTRDPPAESDEAKFPQPTAEAQEP